MHLFKKSIKMFIYNYVSNIKKTKVISIFCLNFKVYIFNLNIFSFFCNNNFMSGRLYFDLYIANTYLKLFYNPRNIKKLLKKFIFF